MSAFFPCLEMLSRPGNKAIAKHIGYTVIFEVPAMNGQNLTIVTALFDIGRSGLSGGFGRPFSHYLQHFAQLLPIENPMCIYIQEEYEYIVWQHRSKHNTKVILKDTESLRSEFPWYSEVQHIRSKENWLGQASWLPQSTQAKLELYNPLVMSKLLWLQQQAEQNPFGTDHFAWIDAALTHTVHPGYFTHDRVLDKLVNAYTGFFFVCFPYLGAQEIHGFERQALAELCKVPYVSRVARAGIFGGHRDYIKKYAAVYSGLLGDTLSKGLMGTEESLYTVLSYLYDEEISNFKIEDNGLLGTFFEQLKENKPLYFKAGETGMPPHMHVNTEALITKADVEIWHQVCDIHFSNTINTILQVLPQDKAVNIVDIGSGTGRFMQELMSHYETGKVIMAEPLKPAFDFSTGLFKNDKRVSIVHTAVSDKSRKGYLRWSKSEDGNIGAGTLAFSPEEQAQSVQVQTFSELAPEDMQVDLVKIHTVDHNLNVLKGMRDWLARTGQLPLIVFDYGYYEPKQLLRRCLQDFYKLGYAPVDVTHYQGGDMVLKPGNADTETTDMTGHAEQHYQEEAFAGTYVPANASGTYHTSTYIITFNLPQQLELLLESFEDTGLFLLNNTNKYLLNNSTDPATDAHYERICEKYGFTQLRQGNLGICRGRQFIAEHFAGSEAEYMFFFEDDMLLYPSEQGVCRNGFSTYIPELFEKSIDILRREQFDFLKLSFTEFFGDNKKQWAWYNLPEDKRIEYFGIGRNAETEKDEKLIPKTHFTEICTHEGLSYIKGDIYYCNWPQLVSKEGNRRLFLETTWAHPYEQTWMSHFYQLTRQGKLKPGLLLASPINHNRVFHYKAEERKES